MQRQKLAAAAAALVVVTLGTAATRRQTVAELGDVRYSVLDAAHFRAVHGDGWVLMDGRNINNTALCQDQGFCQLPDARGVFIRGMNLGRAPDAGDADGDRQLGALQADAIKSHQHRLEHIGELGWSNVGNGSAHRIVTDDGGTWGNWHPPTTTTSVGHSESRPRNIALYTYIKVDR
jgi:hypothetical protein